MKILVQKIVGMSLFTKFSSSPAKPQSELSCVDMMTHCRPLTQMAQSRLA